MAIVVDRFEGGIAICECMSNGKRVDIAKSALPDCVREGDLLRLVNGTYVVDEVATSERNSAMQERLRGLGL